jgi:hypothetical protein
MTSPFSMSWDPISDRPTMIQHDEATNKRWAADADRLASSLELCEVIPDSIYEGDQAARLWSSPIRLAKQRGVSLLADDAALRATARTEGVPSFSSLHVLHALIGIGEVDSSAISDAYQRLMAIRAADLPLLADIVQIAADDGWKPNSYAAFLLARPVTWNPVDRGLNAYMSVMRSLPQPSASDIGLWCTTAFFGLCQAIIPPMLPVAASTVPCWTVLHFRDPEVLPAVLDRCQNVLARFNPNINLLREVVLRIVAILQQIVPPEHLAGSVIPLFQGLDEERRSQALQIFLTSS